ncbi:MAG TPA: ATP synthase F1 subunit delta [Thermoanaerobaculia bacterium]|jgi:F-type H+-transporting ATPase subunit delta|nr:ATP synthase F1 subunit delta [Thermoanaerobaculia bacterium]
MSSYSRSYAQAFLDAAPPGYDVERFLEAGGTLARAMSQDTRLRAFFASPAVPAVAKKKALAELAAKAGVDEFGRRLLDLALDRRRILNLSEILSRIRTEHDRQSGVVSAKVTVAAPVGDEDRRRIADALGRRLNRKVRVELGVDETILGGFVAKVGSEVFDASIRNAIERFQRQTKEGAGA